MRTITSSLWTLASDNEIMLFRDNVTIGTPIYQVVPINETLFTQQIETHNPDDYDEGSVDQYHYMVDNLRVIEDVIVARAS